MLNPPSLGCLMYSTIPAVIIASSHRITFCMSNLLSRDLGRDKSHDEGQLSHVGKRANPKSSDFLYAVAVVNLFLFLKSLNLPAGGCRPEDFLYVLFFEAVFLEPGQPARISERRKARKKEDTLRTLCYAFLNGSLQTESPQETLTSPRYFFDFLCAVKTAGRPGSILSPLHTAQAHP